MDKECEWEIKNEIFSSKYQNHHRNAHPSLNHQIDVDFLDLNSMVGNVLTVVLNLFHNEGMDDQQLARRFHIVETTL